MTEETKLEQTKSYFKLMGAVTRIDRDKAYQADEVKEGKNAGKNFRSIRFGVKTSDTNEISVSMYSTEPEEVFLWNSEKAKKAKEKGSSYKGDKVEFKKWLKNEDKYKEKGYTVLQSRIGLELNDEGKIVSKGLPSYVSIKEIYDNLNNGDSVVIEGNIGYSSYKNAEDKDIEVKNYNIEKIFRLKNSIDFDDEEFEEVTYFEQEMVFVDSDDAKDENKLYVIGRHINYNKSFKDVQFVVDYNGEDGKIDKDMQSFAKNLDKSLKFGDLIKVFGNTVNREVLEEVEEELDEEEALIASFGGKKKPKHAETFTVKNYVTEMQIHGLESWDKEKYTDEDFETDDLLDDDDDDVKSLGGKNKKDVKGKNPFEDDDDAIDIDIDIDDDDLPF